MVDIADPEDVKRELLAQTAKIPWVELARFFAAGKVIYVSRGLDLLDVGKALIVDNKEIFEHWIANSQIHPVNDKQAKRWTNEASSVWACAVSPWVLIQEIVDGEKRCSQAPLL